MSGEKKDKCFEKGLEERVTIGENHSISQQRVLVFKLKFENPHFRPQKKIRKNSKRQFDDSDIMQLFSAGTTIFLEKFKKITLPI